MTLSRRLARAFSREHHPLPEGKAEGVSVVIPTLDEEDTIARCIEALRRDPVVVEVIVVDGGSKDETRARAEAAGAKVTVHDAPFNEGGGRGGQIARGVGEALSDVVAVVHADTLVPEGALGRALELLRDSPSVIGGALGARFTGPGLFLRVIELANDLRAKHLGISFGDQVQFFRRRPVLAAGLPPSMPLMEDVELALRLAEMGRVVFLGERAEVSPRRWKRGRSGRAILVISLTSEYLLRRLFGPVDTVAMYRRYYR